MFELIDVGGDGKVDAMDLEAMPESRWTDVSVYFKVSALQCVL